MYKYPISAAGPEFDCALIILESCMACMMYVLNVLLSAPGVAFRRRAIHPLAIVDTPSIPGDYMGALCAKAVPTIIANDTTTSKVITSFFTDITYKFFGEKWVCHHDTLSSRRWQGFERPARDCRTEKTLAACREP